MFSVVVLLEGEASPQQFLSQYLLYLVPSIFPSTWPIFPDPGEGKHPHSIILTPPCFTAGMVCLQYSFSSTHCHFHAGQNVLFWSHLMHIHIHCGCGCASQNSFIRSFYFPIPLMCYFDIGLSHKIPLKDIEVYGHIRKKTHIEKRVRGY